MRHNLSAIGNINPIRYRGYYYDNETKLYYLKTRYYDPEIGRFVSTDNVVYLDPRHINGLNLYAYCGNNPITNTDPDGTDWNSFWNGVGNWFKKTFGFFVDKSKTIVSNVKDYFFGGYENGIVETKIDGDSSKPVSFYVKKASSWWKFWEYKVGVAINIGDFHFSADVGLGESGMSVGYGDSSYNFTIGINKCAIGHTYSLNGVSYYDQWYVRTIPTVLLAVAVYYTGGIALIPVVSAMAGA